MEWRSDEDLHCILWVVKGGINLCHSSCHVIIVFIFQLGWGQEGTPPEFSFGLSHNGTLLAKEPMWDFVPTTKYIHSKYTCVHSAVVGDS